MSIPLLSGVLNLVQFAPEIASWLMGEKAGNVARDVLNLASNITGHDDPVNMAKALREDGLLAQQFNKSVMEIVANLELSALDDVRDARKRDSLLINSGRKNVRADVMVICAAFGLVVCLLCLVFFAFQLSGEAVGIISTVAGIFGACLKDAYAFEFGSSRGSKEKDSTVAAMLERGLR